MAATLRPTSDSAVLGEGITPCAAGLLATPNAIDIPVVVTRLELGVAQHIAGVASRWTGIPVEKMLERKREKPNHMEDTLGKRVVGEGRRRRSRSP